MPPTLMGRSFPGVNLHLKVQPLSQTCQQIGILSLQAIVVRNTLIFHMRRNTAFCVCVCLFGHNYSIFRNQKVRLNNEYAFAFPCFVSLRSGQ